MRKTLHRAADRLGKLAHGLAHGLDALATKLEPSAPVVLVEWTRRGGHSEVFAECLCSQHFSDFRWEYEDGRLVADFTLTTVPEEVEVCDRCARERR